MEKKERRRSVKFSDLPDVFRAASSFEAAPDAPEGAATGSAAVSASDSEAAVSGAGAGEPIPIDEIVADEVSDLPSHATHNHTTNLMNRLALHFPAIRRAYTVILRAFLARARAIATTSPDAAPAAASASASEIASPPSSVHQHLKTTLPGSELPAAAAPLIPAQLSLDAASLFTPELLASPAVDFQTFLVTVCTSLYLPNPPPAGGDAAAVTYQAVRRGVVAVAWAFEAIAQQRPEGGFTTDAPEKKAKNPDAATEISDVNETIDVEQFKSALFGTVTAQETVELLEKRFGELDMDKSGKVVFAEFAIGLMKWVGLEDEEDEEDSESAENGAENAEKAE